jgi:hypothetical protein
MRYLAGRQVGLNLVEESFYEIPTGKRENANWPTQYGTKLGIAIFM